MSFFAVQRFSPREPAAELGVLLLVRSLKRLFGLAENHMGYYVRAFCTAAHPPTIRTVLDTLADWGVVLTPEADYASSEVLDAPGWEQFEFLYKPGKNGIVVECNRHDGSGECLAAGEIAEFAEMIGPPGRSKAKRKVLDHLHGTRFIIACQLSSSDIDEDGFEGNDAFLTYFEDMCGGMIQADGEGFYNDDKLLVAVK
jgi:hypothetical protein